ncbi:MAG TPA: segregation/condensation protein A [Syntrophorhabdaceae bacterium]|jgi:segregation and condensation protein A
MNGLPTPLEVSVACYEGPLAVLLTLIKKNKVSIWDVPLASITDRFLQYVDLMTEMNLRVAEDFIEMASLLIFIKSKMLLPSDDDTSEENQAEQFVERIIEYEKIRNMSQAIDELPLLGRDVFGRGVRTLDREMEYDLLHLSGLFFELLRNKEERYLEVREIKPTLEEKIKALREVLDTSGLYVWSVDGEEEQTEKVATILGMLELTKIKLAVLIQRRPFGKVILRKKGPPALAGASPDAIEANHTQR